MGMTEPNAGSDAVGMKTSAKKIKNGYVLNGEKSFITNGSVADIMVIHARTSSDRTQGISSFIVENKFKGFSVGKKLSKMGMRGSPTTELIFKDCEVPEANRIKNEGDGLKVMMHTLDLERITISGISLGIAQASLSKSLAYAQERKQFEKPIIKFQMVQKLIADMATELGAAKSFTYQTAHMADQGYSRELGFSATACKLFASEMATRAGMNAIQVYGGYDMVAMVIQKNTPLKDMPEMRNLWKLVRAPVRLCV